MKRLLIPFFALVLCSPAQAQFNRPLFESETNIEMRQETDIDIRLPDIEVKAPDVDVDVHIPDEARPDGVHAEGDWVEVDYVLNTDSTECKLHEKYAMRKDLNHGMHGICGLFVYVDMDSIKQQKSTVSFRYGVWMEEWLLSSGEKRRHWDVEMSFDDTVLARCPDGEIYNSKLKRFGRAPKLESTAKFVCSLL